MDYESLKRRFEAVFSEVKNAEEAFGISTPTEEIIRDLLTAVQAEEDIQEFFESKDYVVILFEGDNKSQ